jgi:hypothetical protein
MMDQLNMSARTLALSSLRQRHPHASEAELRRRLADLLLGPALAAQVYGPMEANYTAVELRTGVFAGEETPVLNQSEV